MYDKVVGLLHNCRTYHWVGREKPPGFEPMILHGKVWSPDEGKEVSRTRLAGRHVWPSGRGRWTSAGAISEGRPILFARQDLDGAGAVAPEIVQSWRDMEQPAWEVLDR